MDGAPKTASHANAEPARDGIVSGYADGHLRLLVFCSSTQPVTIMASDPNGEIYANGRPVGEEQ